MTPCVTGLLKQHLSIALPYDYSACLLQSVYVGSLPGGLESCDPEYTLVNFVRPDGGLDREWVLLVVDNT